MSCCHTLVLPHRMVTHTASGALEHLAAIRRRRYRGRVLAFGDDLLAGPPGKAQTLFIDVDEGDFRISQQIKGQQVAHQAPREPQTTRSDEDDFGHDPSLSLLFGFGI